MSTTRSNETAPGSGPGTGRPPVVRDKRRIDPATGTVRHDSGADPDPGATPPDGATDAGALKALLEERTADLQRLSAEYANYRKRVERDRDSVRELAVIGVLSDLLPVLDDIGRARDHGELVGGFKLVAESLEATLNKLGLQAFGAEGDPFDPNVHEALMHEYSADVTEATCVALLQPGYRMGERVVRPARVKVVEPESTGDAAPEGAASSGSETA